MPGATLTIQDAAHRLQNREKPVASPSSRGKNPPLER